MIAVIADCYVARFYGVDPTQAQSGVPSSQRRQLRTQLIHGLYPKKPQPRAPRGQETLNKVRVLRSVIPYLLPLPLAGYAVG